MVDFLEKHGEFVREMDVQHNEQSKWTRENWKVFKIVLKAQNTRFSRLKWVANKSLDQVTKLPLDKIWKICLSVFRDWKVHPRGSTFQSRREPRNFLSTPRNWSFHSWTSRQTKWWEILLCKLTTGSFWKTKSFSWLWHWPARESRKPFV